MENSLPKGWTKIPLENCCDILDNIRVPINSEERAKRTGNVPYYGATGQVGLIDNYLFNEEIILIGEDGAPFFDKSKNIAFVVEGKSWVNNHAHVLKANSLTSNRFLLHYLNNFDYTDYVNGTTRLKLTQGKLKEIPVLLPPLKEQQRIVAKLDAVLVRVNNCKSRLEKIPALLKNFRQRVLAAAVSGEFTNIEEIKLDSLGNLINDLKYGTSQKSDYKNEGVAILRIPNIGTDGKIINSDIKYADLPKNEYSKLRLIENDILLIRSNGSVSLVGRTAIVSKEQVGFAYAGYLIRLRCNLQRLLPKYLNLILSSNDLRTQIELVARSTSGVNNINSEEVKALQIPTPSIEGQKVIVRKVGELFRFADSIEARYQKAKAWFDKIPQAILAKAFRGELVAQDENDEPASILLERIQNELTINKLPKNKSPISLKRKHNNMKFNKPVNLKERLKDKFKKKAFVFSDFNDLF